MAECIEEDDLGKDSWTLVGPSLTFRPPSTNECLLRSLVSLITRNAGYPHRPVAIPDPLRDRAERTRSPGNPRPRRDSRRLNRSRRNSGHQRLVSSFPRTSASSGKLSRLSGASTPAGRTLPRVSGTSTRGSVLLAFLATSRRPPEPALNLSSILQLKPLHSRGPSSPTWLAQEPPDSSQLPSNIRPSRTVLVPPRTPSLIYLVIFPLPSSIQTHPSQLFNRLPRWPLLSIPLYLSAQPLHVYPLRPPLFPIDSGSKYVVHLFSNSLGCTGDGDTSSGGQGEEEGGRGADLEELEGDREGEGELGGDAGLVGDAGKGGRGKGGRVRERERRDGGKEIGGERGRTWASRSWGRRR